MSDIQSPCVLICSIHQESGFCHGCGRTVDEIMAWTKFSDAGREAIMELLPDRMATLPTKERRVTKRRQRQRDRSKSPAKLDT